MRKVTIDEIRECERENRAIAIAERNRNGTQATIKACPYCGKGHLHGAGLDGGLIPGYRSAHCSSRSLAGRNVPPDYLVAYKDNLPPDEYQRIIDNVARYRMRVG